MQKYDNENNSRKFLAAATGLILIVAGGIFLAAGSNAGILFVAMGVLLLYAWAVW
jgi:hypothetical protein